jgi:pectate lyase
MNTSTGIPPTGRKFGAIRAGLCAAVIALASPAISKAVDGWATQGGGTTGGAGGSTVTVSTLSAFTSAVTGTTAKIINVSGTINLGSSDFDIGSNKTIIGVGSSSGFIGDLRAKGQTNLILQNLNFTNPNGVGDADGLTFQKTTRYFVTHCTFVQCTDGEFDQTHACDYGTVSWCKFYYKSDTGHDFVNLIGHSDSNASEDTGHLRITMHHNWYSTLCKERMPRVRFGHVHVYNNYYGAAGNNYNVGVGNDCQILLQNCYFDSQTDPWKNYSSSGHQGLIHWSGNTYVNTTQPTWAPNSTVFTPPYSYSLTASSSVKSVVTNSSTGAGAH